MAVGAKMYEEELLEINQKLSGLASWILTAVLKIVKIKSVNMEGRVRESANIIRLLGENNKLGKTTFKVTLAIGRLDYS